MSKIELDKYYTPPDLAEYLEEQGLIKRNDNPKIKNDEIYYKTETEKKSIVGI